MRDHFKQEVLWMWALPGMVLIVALLAAVAAPNFINYRNKRLVSSLVTLDTQALLVTPVRPLQGGPFSKLCVVLPAGYEDHTSSGTVRAPDGMQVALHATVTTTQGALHAFDSLTFLQGRDRRYACLFSTVPVDPQVRYAQVVLWASAPLQTDEIRWIISDK